MNEKELKKLNRKQLLELLLQQTERSDALQLQLEQTKGELEKRILMEKEAGSIADASLKLNGVFEAAQAAADQYLENIRHIQEDQLQRRKSMGDEYLQKARTMIAEVKRRCDLCEKQSREKADGILAQAEESAARREQEAKRLLTEAESLYSRLKEIQERTEKKASR